MINQEAPGWLGFPLGMDYLNIPLMRELFDANPIPDLKETLEELDRGKIDAFMSRVTMLDAGHVPPDFLLDCWRIAKREGRNVFIVRHGITMTADDYRKELELRARELACVDYSLLKTVTAVFPEKESGGYRIVLISGFSDFLVSKQDKRDLATVLGLENWSARRAILNPPITLFDTWEGVQYKPGMVKPMVEASYAHNVDAICLRRSGVERDYVAFTASALDSLVVPTKTFLEAFNVYSQQSYRGAERVGAGDFDIWLM